jgi:hypothetical protein
MSKAALALLLASGIAQPVSTARHTYACSRTMTGVGTLLGFVRWCGRSADLARSGASGLGTIGSGRSGFGDLPHYVPTRRVDDPEGLFTGWMLLTYHKRAIAPAILGRPERELV